MPSLGPEMLGRGLKDLARKDDNLYMPARYFNESLIYCPGLGPRLLLRAAEAPRLPTTLQV